MKIGKKSFFVFLFFCFFVIISIAGYYFWYVNYNNTVSSDINPLDLLVFEIKFDNLTDFQKEKAFERFNKAKNIILKNESEENEEAKNNANFSSWLAIAIVQKSIGDYERAAKIWIWFTDIHSGNSISPANLGDLYKSFVVDNEKSEKYYKIAIAREKEDWQIYYGFYELYRYNFQDPEKAISVLKDGAKNNPDDINYIYELSDYLISLNRQAEAEKIIEEYISRHPESASLRNKLK